VTSVECVDRAINAPDLTCPLCGKIMAEWIVGDNPVHICSSCNVLSFDLESIEILDNMELVESDTEELFYSCPQLEGNLKFFKKDDLDIYHCSGTSRIFAIDRSADIENIIIDSEDCRLPSQKVSKLGKAYDNVITKIIK